MLPLIPALLLLLLHGVPHVDRIVGDSRLQDALHGIRRSDAVRFRALKEKPEALIASIIAGGTDFDLARALIQLIDGDSPTQAASPEAAEESEARLTAPYRPPVSQEVPARAQRSRDGPVSIA